MRQVAGQVWALCEVLWHELLHKDWDWPDL
jgi:hypothetical protein